MCIGPIIFVSEAKLIKGIERTKILYSKITNFLEKNSSLYDMVIFIHTVMLSSTYIL